MKSSLRTIETYSVNCLWHTTMRLCCVDRSSPMFSTCAYVHDLLTKWHSNYIAIDHPTYKPFVLFIPMIKTDLGHLWLIINGYSTHIIAQDIYAVDYCLYNVTHKYIQNVRTNAFELGHTNISNNLPLELVHGRHRPNL